MAKQFTSNSKSYDNASYAYANVFFLFDDSFLQLSDFASFCSIFCTNAFQLNSNKA